MKKYCKWEIKSKNTKKSYCVPYIKTSCTVSFVKEMIHDGILEIMPFCFWCRKPIIKTWKKKHIKIAERTARR